MKITPNVPAKRKFAPGEVLPEAYWITLNEAVEAKLHGIQSYIKHTVGPRVIGGRYKSCYWGTEYVTLDIMVRVAVAPLERRIGWHRLATGGIELTEQDVPTASVPRPQVRKHSTSWDTRDEVIHTPTPSE